MDLEKELIEMIKSQNTSMKDQNTVLIGIGNKVDMMWKFFVGVIYALVLTVVGALLHLVIKG